MKLFIATPTGRSAIFIQTCASISALTKHLACSGIDSVFVWNDGAHIDAQRDHLAAQFLNSDATHLLFVDSDVSFPAQLAMSLIEKDKDVVGAMCPSRGLNLPALAEQIRGGADLDHALASTSTYGHFTRDGAVRVSDDGLCRLDGIGMGLTLISRKAFEAIDKRDSAKSYGFYGTQQRGYFLRIVSGGAIISEDISFCLRFKDAGGEIWGLPTKDIGHIGTMTFRADFNVLIKQSQLSQTP
jgi:hypothetical protein